MDLVDGSAFTVVPPRLRGVLPRLAQRMVVERLATCVSSHSGDEGLVASLEAYGALAEGFSGEAGSFIRRRAWTGHHKLWAGSIYRRVWECYGQRDLALGQPVRIC